MNRKGQADDIGKIIGSIIGLFIFVIFGSAVIGIIFSTMSSISQDQCKPYQEEAERLKTQYDADQITINQTVSLLNQCKNEYIELENSTITKKDFEEVKGYFNLTQNGINTINKKIDGIDRIYNFYTIKNYSFALNIIFAIEILSLLLLKNEFALAVFNWIRRKRNKSKTSKENSFEEKQK
jgi:hypothetical protein